MKKINFLLSFFICFLSFELAASENYDGQYDLYKKYERMIFKGCPQNRYLDTSIVVKDDKVKISNNKKLIKYEEFDGNLNGNSFKIKSKFGGYYYGKINKNKINLRFKEIKKWKDCRLEFVKKNSNNSQDFHYEEDKDPSKIEVCWPTLPINNFAEDCGNTRISFNKYCLTIDYSKYCIRASKPSLDEFKERKKNIALAKEKKEAQEKIIAKEEEKAEEKEKIIEKVQEKVFFCIGEENLVYKRKKRSDCPSAMTAITREEFCIGNYERKNWNRQEGYTDNAYLFFTEYCSTEEKKIALEKQEQKIEEDVKIESIKPITKPEF
jgi:hypothetical protein